MSKAENKRQLLDSLDNDIWRLEQKKDWYMYIRPNNETVNQIDKAIIQLRKFKRMVYYV